MSKFAPGMRVIIRDEEWMIKKCDTNSYKSNTLQCIGISPLVKDKSAFFLSDLEKIEVVDPVKTRLKVDTSAHYDRSRLYLESQWRQMIPTDSSLHIGHHAVMNILPYQLEPTKVSLKRPRQRILIADAVGLGKTLEAGILMSELIARGKGQRILVVTVKSMMNQFQKEMWERFTIPPSVLTLRQFSESVAICRPITIRSTIMIKRLYRLIRSNVMSNIVPTLKTLGGISL